MLKRELENPMYEYDKDFVYFVIIIKLNNFKYLLWSFHYYVYSKPISF